jgi:hypothetical protein
MQQSAIPMQPSAPNGMPVRPPIVAAEPTVMLPQHQPGAYPSGRPTGYPVAGPSVYPADRPTEEPTVRRAAPPMPRRVPGSVRGTEPAAPAPVIPAAPHTTAWPDDAAAFNSGVDAAREHFSN